MEIRRFQIEKDLERLEAYLREQYAVRLNAVTWLPQRLQDLLFRVGAQEADEGRPRPLEAIFLWEEDAEIIACILPDGENIYLSIKDGFEQIFPSMIAFGEKNCLSLFAMAEDGTVKIWFAVSDSLPYAEKTLQDLGYQRYPEKEYMNCVCPKAADVALELPEGIQLLYGEDYPDEENKWSALRLGFHPDWESPDYRASMHPYDERKRSSLYPDSFECVVIDKTTAERNNVCAYCFVYVDKQTGTALIEPVSTREKYQHKGFGTAMMHGALLRCRQLGIEKCYVDSFGWRKDFYTAAGFHTEDSISFWYKTQRPATS